MNKIKEFIKRTADSGQLAMSGERKAESGKWTEDRGQTAQNDGSTTAKIKNQKSEFKIEVLDNPNRTVPYAMNIGINAAKGDIILRFDGHAIMEPDYVSNCVKYLEQTKADNVGGPNASAVAPADRRSNCPGA